MLRRILFLLVLLGLAFIVFRIANPSGAERLISSIREFPSKIFSKKNTSSVEIKKETWTSLELIPVEIFPELGGNENVETNPIESGTSSNNFDSLFSEEEEIILPDQKENESKTSWSQESKSSSVPEKDTVGDSKSSTSTPLDSLNSTTTSTATISLTTNTSSLSSACFSAGQLVQNPKKKPTCCVALKRLYYRPKSSEVLCFDPKLWTPACKNSGTDNEWRYYPNGTFVDERFGVWRLFWNFYGRDDNACYENRGSFEEYF
jgi:hypothetical protein